MHANVEAYAAACLKCQRIKDHTITKSGLIQPLPPPMERFTCYTMDFVFRLPLCKGVNGTMTMVNSVKVHMPLLDHSQHAQVAPNTGLSCNTHTIMHVAEQYIFCTPRLSLLGKSYVGF